MATVPILFADDDLLVVDKPAGVLVVPAPRRAGDTVVDLVGRQIGRRVHAVHRLDEETTGALVLAISDAGRAGMEALFRAHAPRREYRALLAATPSPPAGRIESRLRESGDLVQVVQRGGEVAITHYEAIARRGRCCLVRCRLETGRRNQIRVHMAALGCPVAGDRKYGFRPRSGETFRRVMLHSWRIAFVHPVTGVDVDVTVEPPEAELRP